MRQLGECPARAVLHRDGREKGHPRIAMPRACQPMRGDAVRALECGEDAIKLYEAGLINQHSIGFSTLKSDVNQKTGVRTITELKLYEGHGLCLNRCETV